VASHDLIMSPPVATTLFVIAVLAGVNYRRTWKAEGPTWLLWAYGTAAAVCLLVLGFVPVVGAA
jgi:hypothetical protein